MRLRRFAFALALAAIPVCYLLSPAVLRKDEHATCSQDVRFSPALGFPWNCDSPIFVALAQRPVALFDRVGPGKTWQSRPLFIAAGALSRAWMLTALDFLRLDIPLHARVEPIEAAGWLGYLLINVLLVAGAIFLFRRALAELSVPAATLAAATTFLVANHVVKTYFWTPHTQMFNIFIPVFTLFLASRTLDGTREHAPAREYATLLLLGVACLLYGSFLTVGGVYAAAIAWRRRRGEPKWPGAFLDFARRAPIVLLPTVGWIAFVRRVTGTFYSHETAKWDEFVWPYKEYARNGLPSLVRRAFTYQQHFVDITLGELAVPLAILILLLVLAIGAKIDVRRFRPISTRLVRACLLALAFNAVFYAGLGFYSGRLSWNLYPEVLVIAVVLAVELSRSGALRRRTLDRAALAIALANFVYWWIRPGPYA